MLFNKVFELSLNKNYVSHWGLVEAVRELIQNAIDSESPFLYEFKQHADSFSLILKSEFTTLSPQTLLLGSTSKADANDKIGSFGEGYKIALLVLTRLNHSVVICNGDKLWTPKFTYSNKYNDDLLIIEETTLSHKNKGLSFEILGLSKLDVDLIVESCLLMQSHVGAIKQTQYGDILLERPGLLYVGSLFICKTNLRYGYNIKPEFVRLERDRQTVNSFDLQHTTKLMWIDTEEYDRVAELIDEGIPDLEYVEYGSPEIVKEACYRLFKQKYPNAVIAKDQDELNRLVKQGLTNVIYSNSGMHSQVSQSPLYRSETYVKRESVEERMLRFLSDNRSEMRTKAIVNFKTLIDESKSWKHMQLPIWIVGIKNSAQVCALNAYK